MLDVVPIDETLYDKLQIFCNECNKLGYKNNASFEAMKLEWCKNWGEFFCIIVDNKIVSVSGCHPLPEVDNTAWRIFFRSCVLPKSLPFKGLHKQINPKTRLYCRKFIDYLPTKNLYITTNVENNEYSDIFRYHKPVLIESEQNNPLVENAGQIRLYNTDQIIWKFNVDLYNKNWR
jgi:hypothetical protein